MKSAIHKNKQILFFVMFIAILSILSVENMTQCINFTTDKTYPSAINRLQNPSTPVTR